MYKISIIMPIFNAEQYLERALTSILNQTMNLDDIEVIMVDDKSTDASRTIMEKYEKYPNFKAIYCEKNSGGPHTPRNIGIESASGKYLMFLDPDDEFAEDMCETLYNKIETHDVKIVKCNYELISPENTQKYHQRDESIEEIEIDLKNNVTSVSAAVWNAIHDREFIIKNNITFPKLKIGEDLIFTLIELFNADKLLLLNNYYGYKYYTNSEVSHSRNPTKENIAQIIESYQQIRDVLKKYKRTEYCRFAFTHITAKFYIILLDYEGNKKEYLKKLYELEKNIGCKLTFGSTWITVVNEILMKNRITAAFIAFEFIYLIRKTPFIKIYRKSK